MILVSIEKITEFDGESFEVELDGIDCWAIFRVNLKDNGVYLPDLDNYPFSCSSNFVSKTHLLRFIKSDIAAMQDKIKELE